MAMNQSQSESELSVSGGDDLSDASSTSGEDSSVCSSSSSSSGNSDSQIDNLELAKITKEVLRLPRGLCENAAIFREFFSVETWNILPENIRVRLNEFLPRFHQMLQPQETEVERQRTLELLFSGELQRFGHSPLNELQQQLEEGNFRPDVLQLRQNIAKSQRRQQRFQRCERISVLAKQLFLSRERLLRGVYKSAPDTLLRSERNVRREQTTLHADSKLCAVRSRKRFQQEIEYLTEKLGLKTDELSADEYSFDDIPMRGEVQRDLKSELAAALKTPTSATDRFIYSTHFKRRHDLTDEEAVRTDQHSKQPRLSNRNFRTFLREHKRRKLTEPSLPDFETTDIRLRDVCARAQMANNFKHLFGVGKAPGRKSKSKILPVNEPPALVPIQGVVQQSEISHSPQKEVPLEGYTKPISSLQSDFNYTQETQQKKTLLHQHLNKSAGAELQHPYLAEDGAPFNILDGEVELQQEEVETYTTCEETIPRFVIPNEVVLPAIEHNEILPQKLLQTPHKDEKSSMSSDQLHLISDLQQTEHINIPKLEPLTVLSKTPQREKGRQQSYSNNCTPMSIPTSVKRQTLTTAINSKPINQFKFNSNTELIQETHSCFFSLIRDFFCATPNHRMQYNDLKEHIEIWLCNPITALNDWYAQADNWSMLLMSAINFLAGDYVDQPDEYVPYIEFKPQQNIYQWIGAGRDSDTRLSTLCTYWLQRRNNSSNVTPTTTRQIELSVETALSSTQPDSVGTEESIVLYDGGISPPPPPPPRFPTMWTVCAATPEEVIEFQRQERERFEQPHRAYTYRMHGYESVVGPVKGIYTQMYALTKARGHSMMVGNRPNFVTILTLVRDATARLPNGEGTRADIAELLKSSQYINLKEGENVLQTTVSGALDRMHTEHDPCVRYDPKRKIWIYLHRNRTEEDFERIHQQFQGIGKVKKVVQRKQKSKSLPKLSNESADVNNTTSTTESENDCRSANTSVVTTKVSSPFSMPALVPANPIIVSSQSGIVQKAVVKPPLNRSLPVPPLKYNIPHQQQKSLLKSTVLTQRQQEHKTIEVSGNMEHQPQHQHQNQQQQLHLQQQGSQVRVISNKILATPTSAVDVQATVSSSVTNKQFSFTVPQVKCAASVGSTGISGTTPIIVATPAGLQTVHVSSAAVVTASSATTATTMLSSPQTKQNSAMSATVGGKKVALNKPIIINQITTQSVGNAPAKAKPSQPMLRQQTGAQQQQQSHGYIIPISIANAGGSREPAKLLTTAYLEEGSMINKEAARNMPVSSATSSPSATVFVDNSQLSGPSAATSLSGLSQLKHQQQQQQLQSQPKNIIRLVPTISSTGVKSLVPTNPSPSVGTKQPVHVIGHRVVANASGSVRPQLQSQKIGNISLISSANVSGAQSNTAASIVTASSGSTLIKMSPQAFATLQQKQGQQHIIVKQAQVATNQQQRVVVGNTAIISQSSAIQSTAKNVVMQPTPVNVATHKIVSANAISVGSQTSAGGSATAPSSTSKVHTINATNLTPQQQRVLLQNIKQQQQQTQQIHFKTVQMVPNSTPTQQAQTEQTHHHHVISRPQSSSSVGVTSQVGGKAVAVMVSQPQNLTRIMKTNANAQQSQQSQQQQPTHHQHQQQTITIRNEGSATATTPAAGGTRVLSTTTGQIISLESLLQKQGGTLKVSGSTVRAVTKGAQTASINQPQILSTGNTTYTVVSQARGVTQQRSATTQATIPADQLTKTSTAASVNNAGRIVMSSGGQLSVPQIAKVLGKATTTGSTITNTTGTNLRVIKNTGNAASANSFNIANLQGKQVVFAAKPAVTTKNVANLTNVVAANQGQVQHLQAGTNMMISGQPVKLQRNMQQSSKNNTTANSGSIGVLTSQPTSQMQTVIMGNQILRVQQVPTQTVKTVTSGSSLQQRVATVPMGSVVTAAVNNPSSNTAGGTIVVNNGEAILSTTSTSVSLPKTLVLGSGGQTIRLQPQPQQVQPPSVSTPSQSQSQTQPQPQTQAQTQSQLISVKNTTQQGMKTGNANRVVLAVQGGGQIFLSPSFQGNTLNLKSLQNMKVVSLTPRSSNTNNSGSGSGDTQQQEKLIMKGVTPTTTMSQASMVKSNNASSV